MELIPKRNTVVRSILVATLSAVIVVLASAGSVRAPVQTAPQDLRSVDIARDWRFKLDPESKGWAEGWARREFDDRTWSLIDAGRTWESQGFPAYDGNAWYRRSIPIPASWRGKSVYLWLAGIDDEAEIFVDGELVAHFGNRAANISAHRDQVRVEITNRVRPAATATIAVKVHDWGGDGGLHGLPAALATSGLELFSDLQLVKHHFEAEPGLPWPYWLVDNKGWVKPQGAGWTMLGYDGSYTKAIVGLDGSVSPSQQGLTVTPWVFDEVSAKLYAPPAASSTNREKIQFALEEGFLPVVTGQWRESGLEVESKVFVAAAEDGQDATSSPNVTHYSVTLRNRGDTPLTLSFLLALRPLSPSGRINRLYSLSRSEKAIMVNGSAALLAERSPDAFGATSFQDGEVARFGREGRVPPSERAQDERGLASASLAYRLELSPGDEQVFRFVLPSEPVALPPLMPSEASFRAARTATVEHWRNKLGSLRITVPDKRYSDAYYASLAYLLMARNGDLFLPGPLTHRKFWYRDAAYLSLALLRTGNAEAVKPLLGRVMAGQLQSGQFPPILEPDGRSAQPMKQEWDAQGQGVFNLTSYYRWTKDKAWLREAYPTIVRAARFAAKLREETQYLELLGTAAYGILPPSESAEDLGPADWHHYWDDFWTIAGLSEAAFAARELGEADDVRWLDAEAASLRMALSESIRTTQRTKGIEFVPNGPEDTDTSAMARGTTPALWPVASFAPDDPLLRRSFELYFERFIAPNAGAYKHQGNNYWPFGGLQLAHVYLMLGMTDELQMILDWTLDNETFPGLRAWADTVAPATNRYADGDMPHAWVAAEYILLLRDMLAREDGGRLILGSHLPAAWLEDGERVEVSRMPTLSGNLSYRLNSHATAGYWDITIDGSAPDGYIWTVPKRLAIARVVVDGTEWHDFDNSTVRLPARTRQARLYGTLLPSR